MGVEKIEVRNADRGKEILEKIALLDEKVKNLNARMTNIQTDITLMKIDLAEIKEK